MKNNTAMWGCIVCSVVWSSSNSGLAGAILGVVWAVIAFAFLWADRRN